jgi:hypothetical protein
MTLAWHHGVVIMELNNSWKWVVLIELQWVAMNCTIYTISCNFATHATCPLKFMVYKYNELQVSIVTQKLSCKVSCKTPLFHSECQNPCLEKSKWSKILKVDSRYILSCCNQIWTWSKLICERWRPKKLLMVKT